jgi:hypothetical protein
VTVTSLIRNRDHPRRIVNRTRCGSPAELSEAGSTSPPSRQSLTTRINASPSHASRASSPRHRDRPRDDHRRVTALGAAPPGSSSRDERSLHTPEGRDPRPQVNAGSSGKRMSAGCSSSRTRSARRSGSRSSSATPGVMRQARAGRRMFTEQVSPRQKAAPNR